VVALLKVATFFRHGTLGVAVDDAGCCPLADGSAQPQRSRRKLYIVSAQAESDIDLDQGADVLTFRHKNQKPSA
jgi:hypothetical protein